MPSLLAQGGRPKLADGSDWRELTSPVLANLIEQCWAQDRAARPSFGGEGGIVAQLDALEQRTVRAGGDGVAVDEAVVDGVEAVGVEVVGKPHNRFIYRELNKTRCRRSGLNPVA